MKEELNWLSEKTTELEVAIGIECDFKQSIKSESSKKVIQDGIEEQEKELELLNNITSYITLNELNLNK